MLAWEVDVNININIDIKINIKINISEDDLTGRQAPSSSSRAVEL